MPLVMMCGHPSCGKSAAAAVLVAALKIHGMDVVLVDDSILNMNRSHAYKDAAAEKRTRAAFKAEVERRLSRSTVVVLDTLNSIKGFRYEMWCLARAAATRSCVFHVVADPKDCRAWNLERPANDAYEGPVLDDLLSRFERPDGRSRWDAPLLESASSSSDQELAAVVDRVVVAMQGTTTANSTLASGDSLSPTVATSMPVASSTNLLSDIDCAAQSVLRRITEAQQHAGGAAGHVSFDTEGCGSLNLSSTVTLPELRKHKRTFMRLATQNAFAQIHSPEMATQLFVTYLQSKLD